MASIAPSLVATYSNWARKKTRSDSQSSCPYYCRKKVSFPGTFWKRCNRHRRPPHRRWGHGGAVLASRPRREGREGRVERLLCVTVVDHDRRRSLKDENGQCDRQTDRQTRHKIHEVDARRTPRTSSLSFRQNYSKFRAK